MRTFLPLRVAFVAAVAASGMQSLGCSTLNTARPLEPGQHAIGVTAGGPILKVPGVATMPLPHITVEGRHGIAHHFDVGYGLHLLPLLFGDLGVHVGAAYQLNDQPDAWGPALTASEKLYGFSNIIDGRKTAHEYWGMSQTDLTASWKFLDDQLFYLGGSLYAVASTASKDPGGPYLAPFAGFQIDPGIDWLRVQLEARWLAPYLNTRLAVAEWTAPGDQGGLVVNAGVAFLFGGGK